MPKHPIALELIRLAGVPIAAPSANKSGKPSPTTAEHVVRDLDGVVPVVDGGACDVGVESTVVDCCGPDSSTITILRPGGISREQLLSVIPTVQIDPGLLGDVAPKAPGMKYTHYAPRAPVRIVQGSPTFFLEVVAAFKARGDKVGVMCTSDDAPTFASEAAFVSVCGHRDDLDAVARDLYASLRRFDDTDVSVILVQQFPTNDIGQAIMNRLNKSAGHLVISSLPL